MCLFSSTMTLLTPAHTPVLHCAEYYSVILSISHITHTSHIPHISRISLASIPGRVFAFITVRRTTRPGTSCLRMRQIFIVYLWSAKIFNKSIIEICTQKMHRVSTQKMHIGSTQKMHIGSCFTKAWGVASCAAAQLQ